MEWRTGCANCTVPMVTEFQLQFCTEMDIFEIIRPKAPQEISKGHRKHLLEHILKGTAPVL